MERALPSRQNQHMLESQTPSHEELVGQRKLGRTKVLHSTDASAVFDYVHLRAPLPEDLSGSELFRAKPSMPMPKSYFLMRRSSDGYVSATGMFKAAFPWSSKAEERKEIEYLESWLTGDTDEVAGNLWVIPEAALALAADYNITAWIRALLDPRPVIITNSKRKHITEPPAFIMPASKKESSSDATRSPSKRTTSREMRSLSPVKSDATPSERPKASPKKRGRKPKKPTEDAQVNGASKSLQDIINGAPTLVEQEAAAVEALGEPLDANTARVTVTSEVIEGQDGEEVKHTNIKIDMPLDAEEQSLPTSPEQMASDAKKIVKDALELQKAKEAEEGTKKPASKRGRKRKASEVVAEEEDKTAAAAKDTKGPEEVVEEIVPAESSSEPATKRTRIMVPAEEYQREKMQKRALVGTAVAAGIGFAWTAFPYVAANISNLF